MKNLTTPQAVLGGLALIALAVASIPYSSSIVTPAHANNWANTWEVASDVQKVTICNRKGLLCGLGDPSYLPLSITIPLHWQNADGPIPVSVK